MRISVLLPTLNRRAFLREALDSARSQTRSAYEILVSDDGSTDGTPDFVRSISAIDSRVRLLPKNPIPGIFTNFNHLVTHCTGDAFCILGDDDRIGPTYLDELAAPLSTHPHVVASFCDHAIINAGGIRLTEAGRAASLRYGRASLPGGIVQNAVLAALNQSLCIGFSLFRRSALKEVDFDVACGGAADVDYAIRAAGCGAFYFVPQVLADYRQHGATATTKNAQYLVNGLVRALKKHSFVGPAEEVRRRFLSKALLSQAKLTAPYNRGAALGALAQFVSLGNRPANPRVVGVALLALCPRAIAPRLERAARSATGLIRGAEVTD